MILSLYTIPLHKDYTTDILTVHYCSPYHTMDIMILSLRYRKYIRSVDVKDIKSYKYTLDLISFT